MSVILTVEDETLLSVYLGGVLEDAGLLATISKAEGDYIPIHLRAKAS